MRIQTIAFYLGCLLLGGCGASLAELEQMTADERADYICDETPQVRGLGLQLDAIFATIADSELALARGYRTYSSCHQVPSVVPVTTCSSIPYFLCTTTTKTVYNSVCTEVPVAIDGDLEQKKLDGYLLQLTETETTYSRVLSECRSPLLSMTAEEAFSVYQGVETDKKRAREIAECEKLRGTNVYPLPVGC